MSVVTRARVGRQTVRRREFLLGAGTASTAGLAWYAGRNPREAIEIRLWVSDSAAAHSDVVGRAAGYLRAALDPVFTRVRISSGGTIDVGAEQGRTVMTIEWPMLVAQGVAGVGPVTPARDVNLLITDGDPTSRPAGYGLSHVACITGARFLASSAPREETTEVVSYTTEHAVTQLLLHETGHALGLSHNDGRIVTTDDAVIASPMIGGYAWSADRQANGSGCGTTTEEPGGDRRLRLRYSPCARKKLDGYRGEGLP